MSNSKCVYYKEKEQKSIDGGITWVDTGNFRKGGLISTQASQCGSFVTEYKWVKADYVCDNANKYKGYKQQVSHDNGGSWTDTGVVDIGALIESNSKDCGYDEQWFVMTDDNNFICDGAAKYKKKELKYTRNSGTTWNSFDPPKYEKGALIESNSKDCGYDEKWFTLTGDKDFICDGVAKYKKKELKYTRDSGTTWNSFDPPKYEKGDLIEENSSDCGYDEQWFTLTGDNNFICDGVAKYKKKEMKYTRNSGTTWNSFDPPKYEKGDLIESNSKDCGYDEQWFVMTGDNNFICDGAAKYKKKELKYTRNSGTTWNSFDPPKYEKGDLIEENSKDCGYDEKWFTLTGDNNFICDGATKYKKKELKYTRDSGTTWNSFDPPKYEKGDLIEETSSDCASMKVTYTDGTTKYFANLTSIEKDTIGNTVGNRGTVKEIEIYDGVTSIGYEAFDGYYVLTSIKIPNSVTSIGSGAFDQCYSLTSITIPDSVKRIGNYAFSNCSGLTSVTIGNGVINIGEGAFVGCTGLTSISIPNSVTSIGDYAFNSCSGLTSITIPDSVKTIGYHAFYSCSSLRTMTVNATTPPRLGTDAIPDTIQIIYVPASSVDAYKTADGWKDYSSTIFAIGTIPTPSMKVTYKDNREKTYYNLKSIKFDTIVQPKNAKSVEIYDGVIEIGYGAFRDCSSLTGITISSGVTSIGNYAFKGCDKLTTMTVKATTPPRLGDKAISTATTKIYVPASSVNAYKSADGWSNYASKIQAIS